MVEKPVAINADEYKDMIDVAKSHDKHLQDGTMFVHNSRFKSYLKAIRSKDFGGVDRVHSDFSFRGNADFFSNDIRCSAVSYRKMLTWK